MNVKNNESAWSELKPIEQQLYKQQFKEHCELAKSLEEATREHVKLATTSLHNSNNNNNNRNNSPTKAANTNKQRERDASASGAARQSQSQSQSQNNDGGEWKTSGPIRWSHVVLLARNILQFCKQVMARLQGENSALTIEESGALDGFENALRLSDPPEQIFAGDTAYSVIVGSLLLSLPTSCMGLLSSSVSPSLFK